MANKIRDLTGQRFGKLLVLEQHGRNSRKNVLWLCQCDCGNTHIVASPALLNGSTNSCGCLHKERQKAAVTKHGKWDTALYKKWQGMKTRCFNKKAANYGDYGGRGITVCEEWKNDFQAFYEWAMASGYAPGLSIDRIDVNGNYCPENCRWATIEVQNNNQRKSRKLTYNGKTQTIGQWAKETGINYQTIHKRIDIQHMSVEDALTIRPKKKEAK